MENQIITETQTQPLDRRIKYYLAHKSDPEYRKRNRVAHKSYYERNKEAIKTKNLQAYHAKKQALVTLTPTLTQD